MPDKFNRPWRDQYQNSAMRVCVAMRDAFYSTFHKEFPGHVPDVNARVIAFVGPIVRDTVPIVVEGSRRGDADVRVVDVGDDDVERYVVEERPAGGSSDEWTNAISDPVRGNLFSTVTEARTFVALLAAGYDRRKALTFVTDAANKAAR